MLSYLRKCHQFSGVEGLKITVICASVATLAGCSADIARFDLGGSPESARSDYASSGTTGRAASSEYGSAGYDRPGSRGTSVARSELPPTPQAPLTTAAIPPEQAPRNYGQSDNGYAAPRQPNSYGGAQQRAPQYGNYGSPQQGAAPMASQDAGPKGQQIEVHQGDTLYGISRRHGVSLNELMVANGLTSPSLKPGQKLYLPAGASSATASRTARPPQEPNYNTAAASAAAPTQYPSDAPSDWTRSYTVQSGDSMYGIARQNGVKLAELERYNGISDSRKVKPGTVLKLPAGSAGNVVADATPVAPATVRSPDPSAQASSAQQPGTPYGNTAQTPSPTPGAVRLGEVTNGPAPPSSAQQPTMLNGSSSEERVARAETPGSASDAVSPSPAGGSVAGSTKLRWPVAGKMIGAFGPRPDGTHNDGVNLAAPMGTDVHAAESGVVAYAGDELKGYGNLVLIRHDNGWVTAYAHADEIMVKRGDRIKRGQVVAKAGRTGQVDQPQVHFELRQGQKPVDPTPFMERL
jgi:murein DD-endopeptidase MepM/ murein hydrolase activator NlpD